MADVATARASGGVAAAPIATSVSTTGSFAILARAMAAFHVNALAIFPLACEVELG